MSDDENLTFRARSARYLVKKAVKDAANKEYFNPLIPDLKGPGPSLNRYCSDTFDDLPICIIGAGVAGLRIGMFLDALGLKYEILEASDRHGGRVKTHHFTGEEYDYFDVGAMRFPRIGALKLTFELFKELKLTDDGKIIDYIMSIPSNIRLYNRSRKTNAEEAKEVDPFNDAGYVPVEYLNASYTTPNGVTLKGADAIVAKALEPFKIALVNDFPNGWEMLMKYDNLSMRGYLSQYMKPEVPPGGICDDKLGTPFFVVQWMERMDSSTGSYDLAFSEAVLESIQFDYPYGSGSAENPEKVQKWSCVLGGSSVITDLMLRSLSTKPIYNHRVVAIRMGDCEGGDNSRKMFVKVKNHPEFDNKAYSHIFASPPLSCLSLMDLTGAGLSYVQNQAVRSLGYGPSVKIGIKFRTRWWEELEDFRQIGGVSYTDRPVRVVVYPSYGIKDSDAAAVLIASYTWTQDASRLGAFSQGHGTTAEEHLLNIVYNDFAAMHGKTQDWYKKETVSYAAHDWYHDEFSVGAYAHFRPGQYSNFYADMAMPAAMGGLHIVGEAISTQHAWIEGALASAWRCTYQTLLIEKRSLLEAFMKWPKPEEVDLDHIRDPADVPCGFEDTDIDYESLQVARGIELSKRVLYKT